MKNTNTGATIKIIMVLIIGISVALFVCTISHIQYVEKSPKEWFTNHNPNVNITAYQTSSGIVVSHTDGNKIAQWALMVDGSETQNGTNFTIGDKIEVGITKISFINLFDVTNDCYLIFTASMGPLKK